MVWLAFDLVFYPSLAAAAFLGGLILRAAVD